MCGIFGVITQDIVRPEWVEMLGNLNTVRGNLAFGGVVWSPEFIRVFRFTEPFDFNKIELDGAKVFLGHIRAPTGKQSKDIREVHPFETSTLLLAHNGLLLNHTDFPNWRIYRDLEVDSQIIIGGIQNHLNSAEHLIAAITQTISQLEGQQACWLWHTLSPALYLWRVMSSLYYHHRPGQFIFSSVKCELANHLLPEGRVYQILPLAEEFSALAKFKFYNPYKMKP